ncbi:MAG TPA: hypothetical protein PLY87_24195 [Planctomycetaceae bacterium]|nr:hypothetical protein [Planctomycetaceae bacterium]HQZ68222.1 hypothetical protein [Planctomycetaceae bacterium]
MRTLLPVRSYAREELEELYAAFRKIGGSLTMTHLLRLLDLKQPQRSVMAKIEPNVRFPWRADAQWHSI